jgi:hypothetical protein
VDGSVKKVDIKHKHSTEILEEFIKMTKATPAKEVALSPEL